MRERTECTIAGFYALYFGLRYYYCCVIELQTAATAVLSSNLKVGAVHAAFHCLVSSQPPLCIV